MPHLNELYEEYKDEGLVVVGVCTSSRGQDSFDEVVEQTGMKYPVARDPDLKTLQGGEWVVMWLPTYVIVDKKGVVRASGVNNDGMEEIIRKLLAEEHEPQKDDDAGKDVDGDDDAPFVEIPREHFENPNSEKLALVGKPAPPLHATEWMNGEAVTLEDLRGKIVLLDYWATW